MATGQEILFRVAEEVGELHSAIIDAVTSQTVLRCAGVQLDGVTFKYALASVLGKGVQQVTSYSPADEVLTLASGFATNVSAGELISLVGWDAIKLGYLIAASNKAIEMSYPSFYREVALDRNNNVTSDGVTTFTLLTLAAGTYEYALPSDCAFVSRVGIQEDTGDAPLWYERRDIWRQHGEEGALKVRFNESSSFLNRHAGEVLCCHYEAREPLLTVLTNSTKLPLDYFTIAAEIYKRRLLDEGALNFSLIQQAARESLRRLGHIKEPLKRGAKYGNMAGL